MSTNQAAILQQQREAEQTAIHQERVLWLTGDAPTWACGTPVDPGTRRLLLDQSRRHLGTPEPIAGRECVYAAPGTYGHECGEPATQAASAPSTFTLDGVYWARRCDRHAKPHPNDPAGLGKFVPFDPARHVNRFT